MTEKSVQYKQVQTVAHLPHLNVYVYIEKDSPSFLPRIGHLTKIYICLIYHGGTNTHMPYLIGLNLAR